MTAWVKPVYVDFFVVRLPYVSVRLVAAHVEDREVELVHRESLHLAADRGRDLDVFLLSGAYVAFEVVDDGGLAAVVQADDDDLDFALGGWLRTGY